MNNEIAILRLCGKPMGLMINPRPKDEVQREIIDLVTDSGEFSIRSIGMVKFYRGMGIDVINVELRNSMDISELEKYWGCIDVMTSDYPDLKWERKKLDFLDYYKAVVENESLDYNTREYNYNAYIKCGILWLYRQAKRSVEFKYITLMKHAIRPEMRKEDDEEEDIRELKIKFKYDHSTDKLSVDARLTDKKLLAKEIELEGFEKDPELNMIKIIESIACELRDMKVYTKK
jgi:hypothetical protein